jgi:hypothetical protein
MILAQFDSFFSESFCWVHRYSLGHRSQGFESLFSSDSKHSEQSFVGSPLGFRKKPWDASGVPHSSLLAFRVDLSVALKAAQLAISDFCLVC